jgi:cytochrome c oxidase assembly protein subunit 15
MRHRHAGLSIPDFPTAHGRIWPRTDAASVARYNRERPESRAVNPITAFDVHLQMAHRLGAVAVTVSVALCWQAARRVFGRRHRWTTLCSLWLGLIAVQVALGAATVWTGKSADVATAHVAVGSLALALGSALAAMALWPGTADCPAGGEGGTEPRGRTGIAGRSSLAAGAS